MKVAWRASAGFGAKVECNKKFRDIENFPDESVIFPMGDSTAILLAVIIPSVSAINLDPTGLEWTNRPNEKKEETLGDLQTTEKHGAKRQ